MTILTKIRLPFTNDEQEPIALPPSRSKVANRVTVLIGENGVRKSYLLRSALDSILSQITEVNYLPPGALNVIELNKLPAKIFALSATPTDRFPSKGNVLDRVSTKYNTEKYSYIGPRTARNILSRNQSVDEVIRNLLKNPLAINSRRKFLCQVLDQIGLENQFSIGFDSIGFDRRGVSTFIAGRNDMYGKYKSGQIYRDALEFSKTKLGLKYTEELEYVILNRDSHRSYLRESQENQPREYPFNVYVDAQSGTIDTSHGVSSGALLWALNIGLIRSRELKFRLNGRYVNQDQLSAGQWNLFSTMVSLTLSVENDSLILIDEPENGLHPAWQRTFLGTFRNAIAHAKGCHVLVATHSPLILSSLSPTNSDLITLTRTEDGLDIEARRETTPAGWDASIILQEKFELDDARSPELTNLVDEALQIISLGLSKNEDRLQNLVKKIMPFYNNLPDEDLGKSIISSIISVAKQRH